MVVEEPPALPPLSLRNVENPLVGGVVKPGEWRPLTLVLGGKFAPPALFTTNPEVAAATVSYPWIGCVRSLNK
jgi:hypothetical protein